MHCLSSHFSGHHPIERDSHETVEFSAREPCTEKGMRICDERGDSFGRFSK
jgi:hypothetical protein